MKKFGWSGGIKWIYFVKEDIIYGGKNKKDEIKDWNDFWVFNVFL